MTYKMLKTTVEIQCVDIPTMQDMSLDEYKNYIDGDLLFVDHHGILRSEAGGHPLATSKEQLDTLVAYIKGVRHKMEV